MRGRRRLAMAAVASVLAMASPGRAATLHLTTVSWAPFYGKGLAKGGPVTQLAKAAARAVGHRITVTFQPWQAAYNLAKHGKYDGLLGAYRTPAREKHFAFTDAFYNVKVGFVARKNLDVTRYEGLTDPEPYVIAYNDGWAYPDKFENADYLRKVPVTNHRSATRMLVRGKVDLIAVAQSVFRHHIERIGQVADVDMDNFIFLDPLLMQGSLHLAISRDRPNAEAIAADLDRGLAKMRRNGTYAEVMSLYGG